MNTVVIFLAIVVFYTAWFAVPKSCRGIVGVVGTIIVIFGVSTQMHYLGM